MSFPQTPTFDQTNVPSKEKGRRRPLPIKDVTVWAVETVTVAAAFHVAQRLGLFEPYIKLLESLSHVGVAQEILHNPELLFSPEFHASVMGIGFLVGVGCNLVYIAEVLYRLLPNIKLTGTEHVTVEDGVRYITQVCVDGRIARELQEQVEPGSGQMLGHFALQQSVVLSLFTLMRGNMATDFLIGYTMGRALPSATISALMSVGGAANSAVRNWVLNHGPAVKKKEPHEKACGWSATIGELHHWLKFSNKDDKDVHERNMDLLDFLNRPAELIEQIALLPIINTLVTLFPGFLSYIEAPTLNRTEIADNHTH